MKLYDMGIGVALLVAALLFSAHTLGKQYSPQYNVQLEKVKGHTQPYTDKAKAAYDDAVAKALEFEAKYVNPYRTPDDGIDNPIWEPN